jgi:hypothetical protein
VVDHGSKGLEADSSSDDTVATGIGHGILKPRKFHAEVVIEQLI